MVVSVMVLGTAVFNSRAMGFKLANPQLYTLMAKQDHQMSSPAQGAAFYPPGPGQNLTPAVFVCYLGYALSLSDR